MASENVHEHEAHVGHAPKARPDDTPPRNRVIFAYTLLAVITLIALKFVFDSYLDVSRQARRREHLADSHASRALAEYRRSQRERLERPSTSISRAMAELSRRDRMAFPLIRPTPSTDRGPLAGWDQLPREAGREPAARPHTEGAPVPSAVPHGEPGSAH